MDVLDDFTEASGDLSAADILAQMKGLQPRYYSIASSPVIVSQTKILLHSIFTSYCKSI